VWALLSEMEHIASKGQDLVIAQPVSLFQVPIEWSAGTPCFVGVDCSDEFPETKNLNWKYRSIAFCQILSYGSPLHSIHPILVIADRTF
jgi:hypothetical protein